MYNTHVHVCVQKLIHHIDPPLTSPLLQCGNMAREGLRTLVVGRRVLTQDLYTSFEVTGYHVSVLLSDGVCTAADQVSSG